MIPSMLITDAVIKMLTALALGLHVLASVLGIGGWLGQWPLVVSVALVGIGVIGLTMLDGFHGDWQDWSLLTLGLLSLVAALWHGFAPSTASWVTLLVLASVQGLLLIAVMAFMLLFKLTRLW